MPSPWLSVILLVVLGIAFALLTRGVAQRIGRSPNTFGSGDTAHDLIGRSYRVGGVVLFAFMTARAAWPGTDAAFGAILWLQSATLAWLGLAMMAVGSAIMLAAQIQMGTSWRIGLNREHTALKTSGLFARSRNPTCLGMVTLVAGAFLVAPATLTGTVVAVAWLAFSIQIRMEEEHLLRLHGGAYEAYRAGTPRWL